MEVHKYQTRTKDGSIEVCQYTNCSDYSKCDCKDIYLGCHTYIEWVKNLYNNLSQEHK